MKRRFNTYAFQNSMRNFKGMCRQLIVPICLFQGLRTLIFPTILDVFLLIILIVAAFSLHFEWI
ncbi:hypothetical protein MUB24_02980 [Lederbergia sp. NSJ-179]|uniref:hypothetical protein n=1 Tax=Lederbergia sp. NSJ-179 TaxID=2931402 RepID=UPI001FD14E86|nr:hypothetical protein [Lederbergia sp. NSJ-179]MCJ7839893.1 hypothetical protein [Lederbergia sp. NSJ-179]